MNFLESIVNFSNLLIFYLHSSTIKNLLLVCIRNRLNVDVLFEENQSFHFMSHLAGFSNVCHTIIKICQTF